eukprot:jgi/Orpsp1_1/1189341/evm.model.d7180000071280.1
MIEYLINYDRQINLLGKGNIDRLYYNIIIETDNLFIMKFLVEHDYNVNGQLIDLALENKSYSILCYLLQINVDLSLSKKRSKLKEMICQNHLDDIGKCCLQSESLEYILEDIFDLNEFESLKFLIENKYIDINKKRVFGLLGIGIDVNKLERNAARSLVFDNDYDTLKKLIDHGLDINKSFYDGNLIFYAFDYSESNLKFINYLIDNGAVLNINGENSCFIKEIFKYDKVELLKILLTKFKLDISKFYDPYDILKEAVYNKNINCINYLMSNVI